jgi:hypothetical protein
MKCHSKGSPWRRHVKTVSFDDIKVSFKIITKRRRVATTNNILGYYHIRVLSPF